MAHGVAGDVMSFGQSHQSFLDRFFASRRFAQVVPLIPAGAVMVDLGCGYRGDLLKRLAGHIREGIGLDLSVDDGAGIRNIHLQAAKVDSRLPVKDEYADVVCALAVIEHVDDPDTCLLECYRVLRPGGVLLLTTPSAASKPLLELLAFRLKVISRAEIEDHKRYYTKQRLLDQLRGAGFLGPRSVVIRTFEFGLNLFARAIK